VSGDFRCEQCGTIGRRRGNMCAPDGWLFFAAVDEDGDGEDDLIVAVCSETCAQSVWHTKPTRLDACPAAIGGKLFARRAEADVADRRERIATAALAGLLADPTVSVTAAASHAVACADALIAALDAPEEKS